MKNTVSKKPGDRLLCLLVYGSAALSMLALLFLVGYILLHGIPYLKPSLFALQYDSINVSLLPALATTVLTTALTLAVAVPHGLFTAIYLIEYAKRGSRFVKAVRTATETLTGIPSIVYGLFGMLLFTTQFKWGFSVIAGVFTLAIMILPLIIRTAEESLKAVSDAYREASFGLGAGRLRTVFRIVLPSAAPGIMAGVILAIGRIVGETAALIYTAGTVAQTPESVFASGRTLAVHMYVLASEGLHTGEAYATATVLLVLVLAINTGSAFVAKHMAQRGTT